MGRFLRENWLWIVVPILLVFLGLALFIWMTEGEQTAPFDYPIF